MIEVAVIFLTIISALSVLSPARMKVLPPAYRCSSIHLQGDKLLLAFVSSFALATGDPFLDKKPESEFK